MSTSLTIVAITCIAIYVLALTYINIFCLMQLGLLWSYGRQKIDEKDLPAPPDWPHVTVQLPVYNERYVIERLLRAVGKLDYPKDRLEIQLLDDSEDETTVIASRIIEELQSQGLDIQLVRRPERAGFKAGALAYGLQQAKGEFMAIFDADFVPQPDFLKRTIPAFDHDDIGVVQTRWEHINEAYSLLTRMQAFQLNVHFTVEQSGRQASALFLQFNGTGGVWRKETIEDAGGWQSDTLTEDLDLSYRAQLRGWRIRYLEEVGAPAELPAEMAGLRSQQHRWMKGGAETARKILPKIWRSNLPIWHKFHSTIHLLSSSIFIIIFVAAVLSYPVMVLVSLLEWKLTALSVFFIGLVSLVFVYAVGNYRFMAKDSSRLTRWMRIIVLFPMFLSLSMGLSLHNSLAVLAGFFGRSSAFIRTPKFNLRDQTDAFSNKSYFKRRISSTVWIEGLLAIYFFSAIIFGLFNGHLSFLFYHGLLSIGFGTICYLSIKHARTR